MLTWCAILFVLGVAAFLDSIFNYGNIFRQVNAVMFMLLSLGLLVRTTTKMKNRRTESYLARIDELEKELYAEKKRTQAGVQATD
jgi:cytochrome c oxidase subunit IV